MDILSLLYIIVICVSTCSSIRVRRDYSCGSAQYYNSSSGTIKSHGGYDAGHNYGKDMHCTWTIEAPTGWRVELTAEAFDLQARSDCYYDYLELFDGPDANSTSLGKYCGQTFNPVSSTGRFLTLVFVTNTGTQASGFKLYFNRTHSLIRSCSNSLYLCTNYKCVQQTYRCDGDDDCGDDSDEHNCPPFTCRTGNFPCIHGRNCISTSWLCDGDKDCSDGSDEITANCNSGAWKCGRLNNTGTSGVITSPGFPSSYPTSLDCKFHIFAPAGSHGVRLTFDRNFYIETDVSCTYDYITVYSDGNTFKHGPYCGNTAPTNFTIPSSHAIVEFNSDKSDTYTGFKVTWTAV